MSKERESGFYWCRMAGQWIVCEYDQPSKWWNVPGTNDAMAWEDHHFTEIDERRIVREEPKTWTKIQGTTKRIPQNE